jgi:hypothetical protein
MEGAKEVMCVCTYSVCKIQSVYMIYLSIYAMCV